MKEKEIAYTIDKSFKDIQSKQCPIIFAMDIIGKKWKLPILWYLYEENGIRYNELKRHIPGITNIMLTKSLRELEEAGLVSRTVKEVIPPQVSYALTESGRAIVPALNELYAWGQMMMVKEESKRNE